MEMRTCTKCGEEKPFTAEYFHRNRSKALGYSWWCKICDGKRSKKYREENPEKVRAGQKKYREQNLEKARARSKKWREANPAYLKAQRKKWCEDNPTYHKKYREANREKVFAAQRKWRKENPHYSKHYKSNRSRNDPTFRLQHNLQTGLYGCLSGKQKKSRTMEYVGIDLEKLWEHFESKFTDGMTRENYGEWHVDHIRPLSSFDFYSCEEGSEEFENLLYQAWYYTNLQPLWAKDNLSKSSKWEVK
tara:strand:- start:26 stop:766 length:741 start_codon:yes stop_codon:yes gene_type:complete